MNSPVHFKTIPITILSALTVVAVFGQAPRTTNANIFSQSSPQDMSVFATRLNNWHGEIANAFDPTPTRTAPRIATPVGLEEIFPTPTPAATIGPKPRLTDPGLL